MSGQQYASPLYLGGPQSRSGRLREEKNLRTLSGFEQQTSRPVAQTGVFTARKDNGNVLPAWTAVCVDCGTEVLLGTAVFGGTEQTVT